MTQADVERARVGYEAARRGDLDTVRGFLHPHVRWHGGDSDAVGACQGQAQALEFMSRAVEGGRIGELVELVDAGDSVVVIMRPPGAAAGPAGLTANVTTFRDGQAIEIVHHPTPESALAAAGVAR